MTEPLPAPPADGTTEWVAAFARELGVEPPPRAVVQSLLAVAKVAAHASQRTAAPIACYLVGRSGASSEAAAAAADAATRAVEATAPQDGGATGAATD